MRVLHSVARVCEAVGANEAAVARRYADHAAASAAPCEFVSLAPLGQ